MICHSVLVLFVVCLYHAYSEQFAACSVTVFKCIDDSCVFLMPTPYRWTVCGLRCSQRFRLPHEWMQCEPDSSLLGIMRSVYEIQVNYGSAYASDTLACFRVVCGIVAANNGMAAAGEPVLVCRRKRLRDGWMKCEILVRQVV